MYGVQTSEEVVDESQETLSSVFYAEIHVRKFGEFKRCDDRGFRNVINSHLNLVICFNQIDFRRKSIFQGSCHTMSVRKRVTIRSDFRTQSPTVTSWTPIVAFLFEDHVQGSCSWAV